MKKLICQFVCLGVLMASTSCLHASMPIEESSFIKPSDRKAATPEEFKNFYNKYLEQALTKGHQIPLNSLVQGYNSIIELNQLSKRKNHKGYDEVIDRFFSFTVISEVILNIGMRDICNVSGPAINRLSFVQKNDFSDFEPFYLFYQQEIKTAFDALVAMKKIEKEALFGIIYAPRGYIVYKKQDTYHDISPNYYKILEPISYHYFLLNRKIKNGNYD